LNHFECGSDRISKIGQYLAKILANVWWHLLMRRAIAGGGIARVCDVRLSSVCPSVRLFIYADHIRWAFWNFITRFIG